MTEPLERELDKALRTGEGATDPRLTDLVRQADAVETELAREAPSGGRERALFIEGVGLRHRRLPGLRVFVPALVVLGALFAIASFGRSAGPGDTLYGVRRALASVGLASSPTEEAERRIDTAAQALDQAALNVALDPVEAEDFASRALDNLRQAEALLEDVDTERADALLDRADDLEDRAFNIIERLGDRAEERAEERQERREDAAEEAEDNSGPGGGDGDSSGPGSGDDGDGDSSGPGSGDNGDDDNSGSGGGDDSSGSGSGDDGDSSGSGSGDDGDGDSSGSGSGDGDGDNSGSGSDASGDDSSGSGSGDVTFSKSGSSDDDGSGSGDGDSSGSGSDDGD